MKNRFRLTRRSFLRAAGVTVALPFLEAMLPRQALVAGAVASAAPRRMAFLYIPNGVWVNAWKATGGATDFKLGPTLAPLERFRPDMLLLDNLACLQARGGGAHARTMPCFLSGVQIFQTMGADIHAGVTMDQFAARQIGDATRFPSLELGCEYGQQDGFCDTGFTCIYQTNLSWRSPTAPSPKEVNPRIVFDRLFAGQGARETSEVVAQREQWNLSILDFVQEQAKDLNRSLGNADRQRMDDYLTSIREIEKRIAQPPAQFSAEMTKGMERPTRIPPSFSEHFRLMSDLLVLAFRGDLTRIGTLVLGNEGTRRSYPELGFTDEHHGVSHHANRPEMIDKYTKINEYHVRELTYFLDKMKSVREGDGTLLDNSMIVYGGGVADGNAHGHTDLPVILFGRGGGTISPGRRLVSQRDTPVCNLYLSMFERMGVKTDRFGDSTGLLPGLSV